MGRRVTFWLLKMDMSNRIQPIEALVVLVLGSIMSGILVGLLRSAGVIILGGPLLAYALAGGLIILVGYALRISSSSGKRVAPEGDETLIQLKDFLNRHAEALVAPNHEDSSKGLRDWLVAFRNRHGPDSVWLRPHEDEPSTSEVFLVVKELLKADREALMKFHADGISAVAPKKAQRLIPSAGASRKVYAVVWD
jgi:hypothetical protein